MNKAFKPLVPGDTIGIIAVSAPTEQARFARGVQALEGFGFKTRIVLDLPGVRQAFVPVFE